MTGKREEDRRLDLNALNKYAGLWGSRNKKGGRCFRASRFADIVLVFPGIKYGAVIQT